MQYGMPRSPAASKSVCRLSTLLIRIHISGSCEDSPYDALNGSLRGRGLKTRQRSIVSLVASFRATLQGSIPQWVIVVYACTSSLKNWSWSSKKGPSESRSVSHSWRRLHCIRVLPPCSPPFPSKRNTRSPRGRRALAGYPLPFELIYQSTVWVSVTLSS